jgi:hypothetical protein
MRSRQLVYPTQHAQEPTPKAIASVESPSM